jgi:asparagine synthase (glutamine-hydrolysing)
LYEEYGLEFVKHLSGMFGLALWDARKRQLMLARDRLGIKPLYVCQSHGRLAFSSELKSLLELPGITRDIDRVALEEYLALGYVPAPLSLLDGIRKLPPATLLVVTDRTVHEEPYWRVGDVPHDLTTPEDWTRELTSVLESSIHSQMVSDVPLGAFLSGGIDSSAVVAFMSRHSAHPVKTYSIGFDTGTGGSYYNELPFARQVAEQFKTEHREIIVKPDITELLPRLLWHMDEPIADAAFITTYLVSKFAREDVTVILSGVGGDELFGGYRRYWSEHLAASYRRIPAPVRRYLIQPIGRLLPSDRHSPLLDRSRLVKGFLRSAELAPDARYEDYVRVFGCTDLLELVGSSVQHGSAAMQNAFALAGSDDPVQRLIDVDLQTQLPDDLLMLTDRMSMATSLECRVPLLDDRLVDLATKMPASLKVNGTKLKYALKQSLRGILPDEIIDRKKRGFGAPIGGWFKKELTGFLDGVLNENRVRERGLFDWNKVSAIKAAHHANKEDYTDHLLSMMNLEIWSRMYLDGETPESLTESFRAAR